METAISGIALAMAATHAVVLAAALSRRKMGRGTPAWMLASVLLAMLLCAAYILPMDAVGGSTLRGVVVLGLVVLFMASAGALVVQDLFDESRRNELTRSWLALNAAWGGLALVLWLVGDAEQIVLGESGWLVEMFSAGSPGGFAATSGLLVAGIWLLMIGLRRFYVAELPEVANRALYWVVLAALVLQSAFLMVSGTASLAAIGMTVLFTASIGVVHGYSSYRVFDIRNALIEAIRTLSFVAIAAAIALLVIYLLLTAGPGIDTPEGLLTIVAVALLIAGLLVPVRLAVETLIDQVTYRRALDPTQTMREFSRHVSEAMELKSLMSNAIATLNRVFRVQHSAIILLTSTHRVKDAVELQIMQPGGDQDGMKGLLSVYSPIYDMLAAQRLPMTQFDISYNPAFTINDEECAFFQSLSMHAYAPIVLETTLIGILAAGPKLDDTAFYPDDLELLKTLAQQTGIALRNARHVDDLQHLYKSMQSLYGGLKSANDELNKMDAVKSDFVTIASHELRTPLAQLRGYTDIIDALNEQGMLDKDQTVSVVSNLRKATERMEELISAMLDVSQLDVDAMDLRLTQTPLESVIRMAIEPLADAINQRKIALTSRGLRGLPPIQADLPRLVQAFRNVIVNAIKFTPDGGRIEIVASVESATSALESGDHIRVDIRDTGVGIDKKNLELVFKKFFRAYDPSLHSTGTYKFLGAGPGLGLTIARGVIEGHSGKIWAESDGHDMKDFPGSVFVIRLPVSTPDDVKRTMTIEGEMLSDHEPTNHRSAAVAVPGDAEATPGD